MKLAAAMRPHPEENYADVAKRAARLGFHGLSIGFDHRCSEAELLDIREALDRRGIHLVELGCYCNFITPRADEAERNLERLTYALQAGALLNCNCAVTYAGSTHPDPDRPFAEHPDNWSDAAWDRLVKRIWALLDQADDLGVRLCFEPHPATTLSSLDSLVDLMADTLSVRVGVALDPAPLFTPEGAGEPARSLAEIFSSLADNIAVARATDVELIEAGPEPEAREAPLGKGVLDYPTYIRLLDALQRDTPLVIKYQPDDAAYARARDFIAEAASEAERDSGDASDTDTPSQSRT